MHAHFFLSAHKYFQFKCAPVRASFANPISVHAEFPPPLTRGISSLMPAPPTLMRLSPEALVSVCRHRTFHSQTAMFI